MARPFRQNPFFNDQGSYYLDLFDPDTNLDNEPGRLEPRPGPHADSRSGNPVYDRNVDLMEQWDRMDYYQRFQAECETSSEEDAPPNPKSVVCSPEVVDSITGTR